MSPAAAANTPLDYRTAFDLAPVGLVLSRNRLIVDCNQQLLEMFGAQRDQLVGASFELLYPTHAEFERTGARIVASLDGSGWYADERVMKRVDGAQRGDQGFRNAAQAEAADRQQLAVPDEALERRRGTRVKLVHRCTLL